MKLFLCFAVVVAVVFALSNEQTATKDSHTATVQQTRTLTHTHAVRKKNKGNATKTIHASHAPRTHTHKHIRTQSTLPILNLTQQKMPKIVTHAHCSALSLNFIRSPALSLSLFLCVIFLASTTTTTAHVRRRARCSRSQSPLAQLCPFIARTFVLFRLFGLCKYPIK